jgi:hypothetical protein
LRKKLAKPGNHRRKELTPNSDLPY